MDEFQEKIKLSKFLESEIEELIVKRQNIIALFKQSWSSRKANYILETFETETTKIIKQYKEKLEELNKAIEKERDVDDQD